MSGARGWAWSELAQATASARSWQQCSDNAGTYPFPLALSKTPSGKQAASDEARRGQEGSSGESGGEGTPPPPDPSLPPGAAPAGCSCGLRQGIPLPSQSPTRSAISWQRAEA